MAMENVLQEANIREEKKAMKIVSSGSLAQGFVATGAAALAIIGLAAFQTFWMTAIATILVGVALTLQGTAIAIRFSTLMHDISAGRLGVLELGGGMTAEMLGGVAGLALGILSLAGLESMILMPVAAIVYGVTLVLGLGATARLNDLHIEQACDSSESRHVARALVKSAEGVQMLFGLGSVVLGILAIIGMAPVILSMVAMLAIGFSSMLSGSAVGGRMLSSLHCA
jgi:hypothetical protein